ncbi:MAG: DUF6314 family protein [Simkaniaceae bacterium]|nr:DUF6314 family protein [Simkaniaceae bacterium]
MKSKTFSLMRSLSHFKVSAGKLSGSGEVKVIESKNALVFLEKGVWVDSKIAFKSQLKWEFFPDSILLSRLREGEMVQLAQLEPVANRYQSSQPHICGRDIYIANLQFGPAQVILEWEVSGPSKAYRSVTTYCNGCI